MRLRAVFKRPVTLSRVKYQYIATGRIATGSVAVATVGGRPLFSASLNGATGKARIFVAPSDCVTNP
jgi:hypothetical protein